MKNSGICVILVHHKDMLEDKPRGNEDYVFGADVLINLIGKEEFNIPQYNTPKEVKDKMQDADLTVGIKYKYHKNAPILCPYTFWVHLPLKGSTWECLAITDASGKSIDIPDFRSYAKSESTIYCSENEELSSRNDGLSSDQRSVIKALKNAGGSAKRAEIQKELDWGEDRLLNILKSLIESKMIRRIGQGKATEYYLISGE